MNAGSVAGVKRALRRFSLAEAQTLAEQACSLDTERAVKELLDKAQQ
jgi:phosphoenolpyruvate-protein kinase (PTS system EI component)